MQADQTETNEGTFFITVTNKREKIYSKQHGQAMGTLAGIYLPFLFFKLLFS